MKTASIIRTKWLALWLGLIAFACLVLTVLPDEPMGGTPPSFIEQELQGVITLHQERSEILLLELSQVDPMDYHHWLAHKGYIGHPDIEVTVYNQNEMSYWSGNTHNLGGFQVGNRSKLIYNNGQWLSIVSKAISGKVYLSSLLLSKQSPIENDYLGQTQASGLPRGFTLSATPKNGYHLIAVNEQHVYARVDKGADGHAAYRRSDIALLLLLLTASFLAYLLLLYRRPKLWKTSLFIGVIFGLRALTVVLAKSATSGLFSSTVYASSSWFPSLGDLWLNVVFGLFVMEGVYALLSYLGKFQIYGVLGLFLALSYVATDLIAGLVIHSSIPFDVGNIPELNFYSFIGILCMAGLMFILYRALNRLRSKAELIVRTHAIVLWAIAMILVIVWGFMGSEGYAAVWIAMLLMLAAIRMIPFVARYIGGWAYLLVFAAYAGVTVTSAGQLQLESQESLLKRKVLSQQDPLGELLYRDFENKLVETFASGNRAELTLASIEPQSAIQLEQQLKNLLPNHFDRYEFHAYVFDSTGVAIHPVSGDKRKHELRYFKDLIAQHGQASTASNLHNILHSAELETYVAILHLDRGFLVTTLSSQTLPKGIGFPELLKDKGNDLPVDFSTFSFGLYRKGELLRSAGEFLYPVIPNVFTHVAHHHHNDGFVHNVYDLADGLLVITHKESDWINTVTTFSYFFLILGGLTLLLNLLKNTLDNKLSLELNFNQKIQFSLVALVLLSLIIFGWITTGYITSQWETKNVNNVHEKIRSVQIEVEHKLGGRTSLVDEDKDYLSYLLAKFSAVFFTDITLFDLQGQLIATSRPTLFAEGLLADRMNTEAFHTMSDGRMSALMHEERIGKFNYVSAYVPFRNEAGETLAYLNLPYFAKQGELGTEISSFLVAFINICVLLFALTVAGALVVTNILTKPLRLIQSTIKSLDLSKANQPIAYQGHDEIGELIAAYNEKVNELEKNALLLAKSEREGAWREMAKQVAHEIKNPLTPMKLNVQMMDRAWKQGAEDWDSRWGKFATSMVEQIDTLSSIASAFSNFAQMPGTSMERLDLKPLVESVTALYSNQVVAVDFTTTLLQAVVKGDKDQLSRVIQNVVKNAVQSIPDTQEGKVSVSLTEQSEYFELSIKDNGIGIPQDQQPKIFEPNFTTKTGGTGLGLAMVKSIIEQHEGTIRFDSTTAGTTFYIVLKKAI